METVGFGVPRFGTPLYWRRLKWCHDFPLNGRPLPRATATPEQGPTASAAVGVQTQGAGKTTAGAAQAQARGGKRETLHASYSQSYKDVKKDDTHTHWMLIYL